MYHSCSQLLEMAEAQGVPIHEIVIENEMKNSDISRAEVMENMKERYSIMVSSAGRALDQPLATEGGLITASGLGAVVVENATVAGSEGGCQAECGVAAAMAAAGAVELKGGTPAMSMEAFSFSLINIMGLVCDPVAGLVQIPCAQRNASQAVNALLSADMALSGAKFPIPTDEVIDAMYKVGKLLPVQLRETAMGGIAATETGKTIADKIFKK